MTGASVAPRTTSLWTTVDRTLMAAPRWLRLAAILLTLVVMAAESLPNVPRQYLDLQALGLGHWQRYDTYGPDSLSDMYGARVILNDPFDMFTKAHTDQTPLEAATWSREASAPYPPVVLLVEAGLYWVGDRLGVGFYGMVLGCAGLFLASSLAYFWRTRWYLFPLLYLNFEFLAYRFVHVQDNTYLVMLVTLAAALWLARAGRPICHLVVAVAATMKFSPLGYALNLRRMPARSRTAFVTIVGVGLVLPYFIWENYFYIYQYGNELKGDGVSTLLSLVAVVPFTLVIAYVQERRAFDVEDRVGWGLVPVALFLALKMNVARHLLLVLLVPDKRGLRNAAAAAGLLVPRLAPDLVPFNASLAIALTILVIGLSGHLHRIGWQNVAADFRRPASLLPILLGRN